MGGVFSVQSKNAEGGLGMVDYNAQMMEIMGGSNRVELRLSAKNVPKKDKLRWGAGGTKGATLARPTRPLGLLAGPTTVPETRRQACGGCSSAAAVPPPAPASRPQRPVNNLG